MLVENLTLVLLYLLASLDIPGPVGWYEQTDAFQIQAARVFIADLLKTPDMHVIPYYFR